MPERKVWTQEEDRVLKFLKQVRGVTKWSAISQQMENQFNILGRNGKQCRERYHNHLDKSINTAGWTLQQENRLFQLQDEVGNKWALISSHLPGRTDNCVKNHFYSKLRKGMRKLNKKILKHFKREYKEIKTVTLYKVIQSIESKGKAHLKLQLDTYQLCRRIKNQIKDLQLRIQNYENQQEQREYVKSILDDITLFDAQIKRSTKKLGRKSSKKQEDRESSLNASSNKLSSTRSVYDEFQSYTNSQLYSSQSCDRTRRSNNCRDLLKPPRMIRRSFSVNSQSEEQESLSQRNINILYKSANSLQILKQKQTNFCQKEHVETLKVPTLGSEHKHKFEKQVIWSDKSLSQSSQEQKIFEYENNKQNINMIGQEQNLPPFVVMRLFSPKKPSHDQIMEMNDDKQQIFYHEKIDEIDCHDLVQNFSELGLANIPKLRQNFDI